MSKIGLYISGGVTLCVAAMFSEGYHHFDEHFQILEFAGLKFGINSSGDLPWEYNCQMRSAIQPLLVYLFHHFFNLLDIDNPFLLAAFLRFLSALLSFCTTLLWLNRVCTELKEEKQKHLLIILSLFLWFAAYKNVRFSSENWSSDFFLMSLAILYPSSFVKNKYYFIAGILIGLSFMIRCQIGFMTAGLLAWLVFIKKGNFFSFLVLSGGILVSIAGGIFIDRWFYEEWTFTPWNYLYQFIILFHVNRFGVDPWWYYISEVFMQTIPPFSLIFILSVPLVWLFHPKSVLTWTTAPFILTHFLIEHKEMRFLFPIINFLPLFIVMSVKIISSAPLLLKIVDGIPGWMTSFFIKSFWIVNAVFLLIICFKPADNQIALYRLIFTRFPEPTVLLFIDDNPYDRVNEIHFYKRKNLHFQKANSDADLIIQPQFFHHLIVTTDSNTAASLSKRYKKIYQNIPDWMTQHFNFNNWTSRTHIWYLYVMD